MHGDNNNNNKVARRQLRYFSPFPFVALAEPNEKGAGLLAVDGVLPLLLGPKVNPPPLKGFVAEPPKVKPVLGMVVVPLLPPLPKVNVDLLAASAPPPLAPKVKPLDEGCAVPKEKGALVLAPVAPLPKSPPPLPSGVVAGLLLACPCC